MTLVEALITVAIVGILLATSFLAYRPRGQELALQRSAFKIASDIEIVREMAMSARKNVGGEIPIGGYGIYFDIANPSSYILFADSDASKNRKSDGSEDIKTLDIEDGIVLSILSPSNPVNITFVSPSPDVFLQGGATVGQIDITVAIQADISKTKIISINKAGLISTDQ